jgi:hypothetical protein
MRLCRSWMLELVFAYSIVLLRAKKSALAIRVARKITLKGVDINKVNLHSSHCYLEQT